MHQNSCRSPIRPPASDPALAPLPLLAHPPFVLPAAPLSSPAADPAPEVSPDGAVTPEYSIDDGDIKVDVNELFADAQPYHALLRKRK